MVDTPERIKSCLNCQRPSCNNCFGFGGDGNTRKVTRQHPPETVQKIMELYWTGAAIKAIARKMGLAYSTTNTIINRERRKG